MEVGSMKTLLSLSVGLIVLGIGISASTNAWTREDHHDRRVLIVNDTSYTMTSFYASNVDSDGWGKDRFGLDVLEPGDEVVVDTYDGTPGYCMYDLKAVFDVDGDDKPIYRHRVNICEMVSWTIH
jgi:hypothetical protein